MGILRTFCFGRINSWNCWQLDLGPSQHDCFESSRKSCTTITYLKECYIHHITMLLLVYAWLEAHLCLNKMCLYHSFWQYFAPRWRQKTCGSGPESGEDWVDFSDLFCRSNHYDSYLTDWRSLYQLLLGWDETNNVMIDVRLMMCNWEFVCFAWTDRVWRKLQKLHFSQPPTCSEDSSKGSKDMQRRHLDTQAICQTCIWLVLEADFLCAPQEWHVGDLRPPTGWFVALERHVYLRWSLL